MRDFLLRLKLDTGGHEYGRFRSQIAALAACRMTMGIGSSTVDAKPIKQYSAWLDNSGRQRTMWPGEIELSQDFFESLLGYAVPLHPDALTALRHSSLKLDLYMWLAHRLHRIRPQTGMRLSWANLFDQFGQEYGSVKDFKREIRGALPEVLAVYPDAKLELVAGGMRLFASKPPVPKTIVAARKA